MSRSAVAEHPPDFGIASPKPETTPGYAWVILLVVFFASVVAPLNQFKVPPSVPQLVGQFHLNMTNVGLLMSVFSIAGFVLSLPTGFFFEKLGAKASGALAVLLVLIGSVWGTYSTTFSTMLASRTLEGAGMAIIGVVAPVMIAAWFPARMRGLSMGVWSTWFSVGIILMMNIAPGLLSNGGWQKVWWFGTYACVAALVLFLVFYRDPSSGLGLEAVAHHPKSSRSPLLAAFSLRDMWLLSISLVMFNILVMAMGTFLPPFLMKVHGLDPQKAGLYSSLGSIVMLVSCPLGGFISDRLNLKKGIIAGGLALISLFWIFEFSAPLRFVPGIIIFFGLMAGPTITVILSVLPDVVKRPELMGFGMAILMFMMKLGAFVGPVLYGKILDSTTGWTMASYCMVPVCLIGAVTAAMMKTK